MPTPSVLRPVALTSLSLAVALAAGCSSREKEPKTLPSQTVSQTSPELEEPPPLPPPIAAPEEPERPPLVKVIDAGRHNQPQTLAEASRMAREQKGTTPPPIAEINDDNLSQYAEGGNVTVSTSGPAAPAPEAPPLAGPPPLPAPSAVPTSPAGASAERPAPSGARDETYWRNGALQLRTAWRQALDEIAELELESAALRQRFYLQDDPYIRDTQVKPLWDRVLDRLAQQRKDAGRYEQELNVFIDDGRRSGALPGWLSEGWELEPGEEERKKYQDVEILKSSRVPIVGEAEETKPELEPDPEDEDQP